MATTIANDIEPPRRFYFHWVPALLFRPRQAFARLVAQPGSVWLTPLLLLTITILVSALVGGWIKQQGAMMGELPLPPDFDYYTPEQQAQYMQAAQATQGPVFSYVLPAIAAIGSLWVGWLLVGGLLHLVTTLLGGRGDTGASMNLVAWSALPFALRDIVRIVAMLVTRRLIANPGLSGFAPMGDGGWGLFLVKFLALIDIYIIWHILLVILGVRAATSLASAKASGGAIFTILVVLLLQAALGYLVAGVGNLTIVRPFFF